MLCYKAWLETRWRFAFLIGSVVLLFATVPYMAPPQRSWIGLQLGYTLLCCYAPLYLAGSGVNAQTFYSATQGFHGSMLFTLSLPVSRTRLFLVRAWVGAVETWIFVALATSFLFWKPEPPTVAQIVRLEARSMICAMAVYAFSSLLACLLDEIWQFTGSFMFLAVVWWLQFRFALISRFSPLRGMSMTSYPLTAALPWRPIVASILLTGIFFCAAAIVLRRKEYSA